MILMQKTHKGRFRGGDLDLPEEELYQFLTTVCNDHPEFSYNYIKKLKFPFIYKGWKFTKHNIK